MTAPTLALLHSPLTSAAAWGALPTTLADRGYRVVVPEVLDDDSPPFAQHYIARVCVQLAEDAPGSPLILVGHSGAGPLLPQVGFARRSAGVPVRGYVFLDAMLPRVPKAASRLELLAIEDARFAYDLAQRLEEGNRFPDWSEGELADDLPDPADRAVLLAGLRPRTLEFFTEPLPLPEDWPDARCGYLQLSAAYDVPADTAERRGWEVERMHAHHFAALNQPERVASSLTTLIDRL